MRWGKKNNSAWALVVPDIEDYSFFPLVKALGKEVLQRLLDLSLAWQLENMAFIKKNLDDNADYFFYLPKNPELKKSIRKTFSNHQCIFKLLPEPRQGFNFKIISDELVKTYIRITIWNLESLLLCPDHFLEVKKADPIFTIKNPREGLILISYNMDFPSNSTEHTTITLPALYDLESIRDTVAYMNAHDSVLYQNRTAELANTFDLIRQNLG